jgi:hypothetical protein
MKTFKTFLFEEMTANNLSISDVSSQIPDNPKNLNFTPATGPSTKPTKPVGKENTKKPNNKRDDEDDDIEPDFDTWLRNHPMPDPSTRDADGDGIISEDEQDAYNQAWQTWRDELLDWMVQHIYNQQPRIPENDDVPYIPGQQNVDFHHWMQEYERATDERYRQPGDGPLNLPFDMSKEDYELWKDLLRIRGTEAREIFDWIWRYYRAGQEGFPHVESPTDPRWRYNDPLFPHTSPGPARRPGEHHA